MEPSAEVLLERIERIAHELEELRQIILMQSRPADTSMVDMLYGALGQGSWEEYDLDLDLERLRS